MFFNSQNYLAMNVFVFNKMGMSFIIVLLLKFLGTIKKQSILILLFL